ncbi:MAG: PfkB family carbohydrate kinase, partial [Solirubrobacterales bacterium]
AAGLRDLAADDVCVVSFEIAEAAVGAAVRIAAERGARLVVNPSPVRPLSKELLAAEPIVIVNAGEIGELTGEDDVAAGVVALQARGCSAVIATLGGDGAHVATRDWDLAVPAFPASPVDTTGAGDTFTGVVAAAVAAGAGVVQAVRRGAAAAALSTEAVGARTGMPAGADIDALLDEH